MDFEVARDIPVPDALPWEPSRPSNNKTWPFVYMKPGESFAILGEDQAKTTYARMKAQMLRKPYLRFEIYEVVTTEIYRCFRIA